MALLQLPVLRLQADGGGLESRSSRLLFLSSGSHVGVGSDHVHLPQFLRGFKKSSSRSEFPRRPGWDLMSQRFPGWRQEGYSAVGSDSGRTQGNDFTPQHTSDRRQDGNRNSRSDSRRNDFNSEFSFSGKQDGSDSLHSDSRRTQGRNSSHGGENKNATPGFDSRKSQRGVSNSRRDSQGENDRGGYAGRDGSSGSDSRRMGTGQGRLSGRNSSNKTPSPVTQTVTPRQSTSQFASDRTVHRAPWEHGGSSSSGGSWERDFTQKNPLVERLQKMQEEVESDYEDDGDVDDDFGGLDDDRGFRVSDDAIARFDGPGEKSAMARIAEKLSSIPGTRSIYKPKNRVGLGLRDGPDSTFGPKYGQPIFPTVGRDWSTPDHPVPTPGAPPSVKKLRPDTRFPWEREDDRGAGKAPERLTRAKPPSLAELTLPEDELKRLKNLGILNRHRIKVGKMGVTNGIVESIHNEWRNSEVVRIKCDGPPAQNMKRTHESLEERTGGLVVWRAGGACLVYRGKDYVPPLPKGQLDFPEETTSESAADTDENKPGVEERETNEMDEGPIQQTTEQRIVVPRVSSVYDPELEKEMEEILSTLGPRYHDWTGMKPVPVDADLLVGSNVKFKKPFRLLPYGVKAKLSNLEMTNLRRLGRPLPPHFVLGVNKGLDGLAMAIVKLWERSELAKIAVKRGIQNTNHERMAEQLKSLTGGVLLSRDKYFIVLYRGKDFLPRSVAAALEERQGNSTALQEQEEKARLVPQSNEVLDTTSNERNIAGTLAETLAAKANWEVVQDNDEKLKNREEASRALRRDIARRIQRKVAITLAKKSKAELALEKVEKRLRPACPLMDRETITEEERHMFRKLGLKMHAFLLLGRRGVFGGTVENMHLHWKHRELVKIIYKASNKVDLEQTARMLEYESGGVLVATLPTNKGQAIIVYRGKNYQRPPELRPRNLLTKRQALKRSIEMQRQKALAQHLLALETEIEHMQADLGKLEAEEVSRGRSEPKDSNSENFPTEEETTESIMFSGLPENDRELIRDERVGYPSELSNPDVIFRADPLSRREKLVLRQQALKERKRPAHFNVGRSNVLAGLARAIRIHFQRHALVKVGVKGRAKGTPVEEILIELEKATGGTLVSQESCKVILYRGWPEGQRRPTEGIGHWEELPPELRSAMISEVEADDDYLHESDWDESGAEAEGEAVEGNEEDDDFWGPQFTVGSSEVDDDWDSDEFQEDDEEIDNRNELKLGLGEDEDGLGNIEDDLDNNEDDLDSDEDEDEFEGDEDELVTEEGKESANLVLDTNLTI